MTADLIITVVFWSSIVLNVVSAGVNFWRADVYMRKLRALRDSPYVECIRQGHDTYFETIVLDHQEPPEFVFTHIWKLRCKRCDYEQTAYLREVINAPGVKHIDATWSPPEKVE